MTKITTKYSPPENHYLTLDIQFATAYGINQALIFDKLYRLQTVLSGYVDDQGNKWVRLTYDEWEVELPFMARNTIIRTIEALESDGLIISTVFERRSKWYRCNPEYISIHKVSTQNGYIDNEYLPKMGKSSTQNGYLPKLPPIPSPSIKGKPKNKKQKIPQRPPKEMMGPQMNQLMLATKIPYEMLTNGTWLDFWNTNKALADIKATAEQIKGFPKWLGRTPTLKDFTNYWGVYLDGDDPPHKQYKQNGANNNGRKPGDQKSNRKTYRTGAELAEEPYYDPATNEHVYPDGRREPVGAA